MRTFDRARLHQPADRGDEQHGAEHQHHRGRPGDDRQDPAIVDADQLLQRPVEPVEDDEGREDRQQCQRRHQSQHGAEEDALQDPDRHRGLRCGLRPGSGIDRADAAAGRAVPMLEGADAAAGGERGQIGELGALADHRVVADGAGSADIGVLADRDRADHQLVADHLGIGEAELAAERDVVADLDEIDRAGLEAADEDALADLGAEQTHGDARQRRALHQAEMDHRRELAGEPPAEEIDTPERVAARPGAPEHQTLADDAGEHHREHDKGVDAHHHQDFAQLDHPVRGDQLVDHVDRQPGAGQRQQQHRHAGELGETAKQTAPQRRRREGEIACRLARIGLPALIEPGGDRAQGAQAVDVLQRDARQVGIGPHAGKEGRGQQRMATEIGEEIGLEADHLAGEERLGGIEQGSLRRALRLLLLFR